MMLHWSLLKFTTCITRTLTWGSLKDNSVCCQIFWTAALDMPPRSPGFAPWQTCLSPHHWLPACLVRWTNWWGSISQSLFPLQLGKGPSLSFDASNPTWDLPCPSSASTTLCSSTSTRIWWMDWICPPSPGSSWMPTNAAGISLALCTVHSETHQSNWG